MASKVKVQIKTSFGGGGTINLLSKILQDRMKYMNETARDSIAACAIDALKSIRAVTLVAKKSSAKVTVKNESSLIPSITTKGNYKQLCIRYKGSKEHYTGTEKQIFVGKNKIDKMHVYRFIDTYSKNGQKYLIVADDTAQAKQTAKRIVVRRILRYAGLAKKAIGQLMHKTATVKVSDVPDPLIDEVANKNTSKLETVQKQSKGGIYKLVLSDNLKYALNAIKGGKNGVDTALKKSMNKIVATINRKAFKNADGGFLSPKPLPIPFPELRKRKK